MRPRKPKATRSTENVTTARPNTRAISEGEDSPIISLPGGQALLLRASPDEHAIIILRPDGGASISISVTAAGAVVRLGTGPLAIETSGELTVRAAQLTLHGDEGVTIRSGKDLTMEVAGDARVTARSHLIRAELGDVAVEANDDVRLNGERVLVQC
jgi:hypothetical protein